MIRMEPNEKFMNAVRKVLSMKISEFIRKYRDLLPQFDFITEDDRVEDLLRLVREGKHYIIVIDKRGRLRGIVTYVDILLVFGKPKSAFLPFSSITTSFSKIRVPADSLLKIMVSRVMERLPQHIRLDESVEVAATVMHMNNIHHVVVVDRSDMVWGLITAHSIFRAILREAGIEERRAKVIDEQELFRRFEQDYRAGKGK